jgi:hypothetical protein
MDGLAQPGSGPLSGAETSLSRPVDCKSSCSVFGSDVVIPVQVFLRV